MFFRKDSPYIIAEVAQSHEGSLGIAMAHAKAAKDAGASAVKFQTHIVEYESTPHEPWRIEFSKQDSSRFEYWKRMEFTFEQWKALKEYCTEIEIDFISSPFSVEAAKWLQDLDVPFWKIASGEVRNKQLLDFLVSTNKPIVVSTGLIDKEALLELVSFLEDKQVDFYILQCTTMYPTPMEHVGLNVLTDYLELFPGRVGLSDHSASPVPSIIAAYLGASIFECHITLSSYSFGPDVSSSLDIEGFRTLCVGINDSFRIRLNPVNKSLYLDSKVGREKSIFGRSWYAVENIEEGEIITEAKIRYLKPFSADGTVDIENVLGKKATKSYAQYDLV